MDFLTLFWVFFAIVGIMGIVNLILRGYLSRHIPFHRMDDLDRKFRHSYFDNDSTSDSDD